MALLFGKTIPTINYHINNLFAEGELNPKVVIRYFRITTQHGAIEGKTQTRDVAFYNLDVIISVGYRVKSIVGTRFRQWATQRLHEYRHKPMYMEDYIRQLDSIIVGTGEKLLTDAGSVSHDQAMEKAEKEYRKYQVKTLSPVEEAYLETVRMLAKEAKDNLKASKP